MCLLRSAARIQLYGYLSRGECTGFFLPFLAKEYFLGFYGGEPLLTFPLIEKIVSFLKARDRKHKKTATFSITTNGYLLTDEIIRFLSENSFHIVLSYDGILQDKQRKERSSIRIISLIEKLLRTSNIRLEINSVFTPKSVSQFSESLRSIVNLGVHNIRYSLSYNEPWDKVSTTIFEKELNKLSLWLQKQHNAKVDIPIINFRENKKKGIFQCAAGKDRLTITPKGEIWGCFLFADYFRQKSGILEPNKYSFGSLSEFMENYKEIYPRILNNYSELSMDNMRTSKMECFLCNDIESCCICPVSIGFSGNSLGEIPQYICEMQKVKNTVIKKKFFDTV